MDESIKDTSTFHSVTLDRERCKGCTNCVKRCPTEAIRVRAGKAKIIKERCIDCGECIRICPAHAKLPIVDSLASLDKFRYCIALPAPVLFGQFNNLDNISTAIYGLLKIGFDDVFEVAKAAELVSEKTRDPAVFDSLTKPIISSACPAVVRMIRVRYPELIDNLLPFNSPMELAARLAKQRAAKKTGYKPEEIGAIFISPCAAKMTAAKNPLGSDYSDVDAVVAIRDVYPLLVKAMKKRDDNDILSKAGRIGLSWGTSGGEASAILRNSYLAADGIENVIEVLNNLEDEKFADLDFVELNACAGGCTGGVLTVANPYMCRTNIKELSRYMPVSGPKEEFNDLDKLMPFDCEIEYLSVLKLHPNRHTALEMMVQLQEIEQRLFGKDCGSCGAPSCHAMAEDIVRGFATEDMCIYNLQKKIKNAADELRTSTKVDKIVGELDKISERFLTIDSMQEEDKT